MPPHLDLRCLQKPIIIAHGSERVNVTLRYTDDLLTIDNIYFEQNSNNAYPKELLLNEINSSDTEAIFVFNI